jgi:hypothetical protein
MKGKTIHLATRVYACEAMKKEFKKKKGLGEFASRPRVFRPFSVNKKCGWCGATWIYNEALPMNERLVFCPQCCDKEGMPNNFEHPKYGIIALIDWARSNNRYIPAYLKRLYAKRSRTKM